MVIPRRCWALCASGATLVGRSGNHECGQRAVGVRRARSGGSLLLVIRIAANI